MSIWIVTKEYNAYDQYGDYFCAAFNEKPTFKELKELLPNEWNATIDKLTRGGGRENTEDSWYNLMEVEVGTAHI